MGVLIESEVWAPDSSVYVFLFIATFCSIFLFPHFLSSNRTASSSPFEFKISSSLVGFQRRFLLLYSLSSALEGIWLVFGEYEMSSYGLKREEMLLSLSIGCLASLFVGSFLGMLSDFIGHKKVSSLFCILHLVVGVWKILGAHPTVLVASICLSLASSIFSFSFEAWMVIEHEKQEHRQDALNDTFWLMIFLESASFIGCQMLVNWLIGHDLKKPVVSTSTVAVFLAIINVILILRGCTDYPMRGRLKDYKTSFCAYMSSDKRIWLLACAQACLHFSMGVFWVLCAPTIVADGREVNLGLIYPCLMGARMLGSTAFPWFTSGISSLRTEDFLVYAFIVAGVVLSIVAYDYQEIGFLVTLFCIFHACAGLLLPSLAQLRTKYVPNEFRGGMISLSVAPANAAILFVLFEGGYYKNLHNSTITALGAISLFMAAGCMHLLKRSGKQQSHQNWHKQ